MEMRKRAWYNVFPFHTLWISRIIDAVASHIIQNLVAYNIKFTASKQILNPEIATFNSTCLIKRTRG